MKKGVAVRHIVLLVLGIIVTAIIGYLLYSTFIATGPTVTLERCKGMIVSACSNCQLRGWPTSDGCDFPADCADFADDIGWSSATINRNNCNMTFGIY
jgi:hypothetical protein